MGMFGRKSQTTAELAAELGQPLGEPRPARAAINLQKGTGPAVARDTVELTGGVNMTKRFDKAGTALSKLGLTGVRAQVVMLLDHSGSMHSDYRNGTVQTLVERALGFAAQVDTDGKLPIIAFDSGVYEPVEVDLASYANVVNDKIWRPTEMSGTNMHKPLQQVIEMAKTTEEPIFLIVIGDGSPADKIKTKKAVIELANYPVFIKFLAIRPVDFLQELDDLPDSVRLLDNVDAKFIDDPSGISDLNFAEAMADEWDSWFNLAQAHNLVV